MEHDERYTLENLFAGLDSFDNVAISTALKAPFIQNLENEVTKIIRDLLIKYEPKKTSTDAKGNMIEEDFDDEAGAML